MDPTATDMLAAALETDLMWGLTEFLFPSDGATAFTLAMRVFAGALTAIAALMVALHVVLGIAHTAYAGKVLGDKFHQIWAPLRVVLGFGLLFPAFESGLSPIHKLQELVFLAGNNVANFEARVGVEHIVKDGHTVAPLAIAGRDLAKQIATAEVCAAVHQIAGKWPTRVQPGAQPESLPAVAATPIVEPAKTSWLPWKEDTPERVVGTVWDYGIECGAVSFSLPTEQDFGSFGEDRRKAVSELITTIRNFHLADGFKEHFLVLRDTLPTSEEAVALDLRKTNLDRVESLIRGGVLPPFNLAATLNAVGDAFDQRIEASAAKNSATENEETRKAIVSGIEAHGWFLLPTYYRTLARVNEKSFSYAGERPVYKAPNPEAWGARRAQVQDALDLLEAQLTTDSHTLIVSGQDLAGVGDEAGILAKITNSISEPVTDYLIGYDGFRPDPVGDLINLGHRLVGASEIGFFAGMAATGTAALTTTASQSPFRIVEYVMVPGWWILTMSFISGAALAYVLPMIPAIFGMFVAVVIAMEMIAFAIAGMLWAFQHVRMDGDDFITPTQSIGYQALFSLGLRQPITVLGFFASNIVSVWVLNLVLKIWSPAFIGSQGNASVGMVATFVSFAMLIYIQWHVQLRLFGLTLELPQRVAAIMGHSISGWGETEHGNAAIAASAAMIASNRPPTPGPKTPKAPPPDNNGGKGQPDGVARRK